MPGQLLHQLPLVVLLAFLLVDPLLLSPFYYGLLGIVYGALGLLVYLTDARVQRSLLHFGSMALLVALASAVFSGYSWNAIEYALVVGTASLGLCVQRGDPAASSYRWVTGLVLVLGTFHLIQVGLIYGNQVELFGHYGLFRLPPGPLRNPNVGGRFFGLVAFVTLVSNAPKWVRYPGVVLFVVPVVLSGSRGALLALLVSLGFWAWGKVGPTVSGRWLRWGGLLVSLLVIGVLVGRPDYATNLQRIKLMVESLAMAARDPLLGVGGWNFGLVYPSVSLDANWQRHAHSLPFQVLAEFGIVGFALLVGGIVFFFNSRPQPRWLPVLVFLLVHELVDTMIWIPGLLLLGLFALRPFGGGHRTKPRSTLLLVVSVIVMVLGTVVWTVDRNYRGVLGDPGSSRTERAHLLSGVAGFDAMNRFVGTYRRTGETDWNLLASALRHNDYDPYYDWVAGQLLKKQGREDLGRRFLHRYASKDPTNMLGLATEETGGVQSDGERVDPAEYGKPRLRDLIRDPTHPGRYVPVVARTIRRGHYDRAVRQLGHLENFPRLTPALQRELDALERSLTVRATDGSPSESSVDANLDRRRRELFHRFFYRRPGRDHVSLQ